MSRSTRKPYYRDTPDTRSYWRTIRREWRQDLKINHLKPDFQLRLPREIINDYNYSDYWGIVTACHENSPYIFWDSESVKKVSRK